MPRASLCRAAVVGVGVALIAGLLVLDPRPVRAEPVPIAAGSRPIKPRGTAGRRGEERPEAAGGWWLGTAGIALALAVCGGISLATRRAGPRGPAGGGLRVVGRASLTPRHTVHLLRVGDRVLIVGTGAQGAPSLLGELTDPAALRRLAPRTVEDEGGDR